MMTSIYWIRTKDHSDLMSEGYIGVSKDASKRWKYGHFWSHKNSRHENPRLSNAIAKHGWDNLVKEILVMGSEDYCYEIEKKLRPTEEIGWNLAVGGGKPPISKFRGDDYVSPLKGISRPTPWMIGNSHSPSIESCRNGGKAGKGRKQTPEQIARRVASRRATLEAQGRTR